MQKISPLLMSSVNWSEYKTKIRNLDKIGIPPNDPAAFLATLGDEPATTLRNSYAMRLTDFLFLGFLIEMDDDDYIIKSYISLLAEHSSLRICRVKSSVIIAGTLTQIYDAIVNFSNVQKLNDLAVLIYTFLHNTELRQVDSLERVQNGQTYIFKRRKDP
jgi:hypothetical protein